MAVSVFFLGLGLNLFYPATFTARAEARLEKGKEHVHQPPLPTSLSTDTLVA